MGTPEEIYHSPVNSYVADFIGGANLIVGSVSSVNKGEGKAHIKTATASVEANCSLTVQEGNSSCLCIRAEDFEIETDAARDDDLSFEARVTHIIFQGSAKLVEVEIGQQRLVAKLDHTVATRVGESITLTVQKDRCRIVDGSPPGRKENE